MNQPLFRMTFFMNGNIMKNRNPLRLSVSALLVASMLAACGGDKPETLLASARDYMAKNDNKAA